MDVRPSANTAASALRLFLVEDSAAIRERLIALIGGCDGVSFVGAADSVAASIDAILRLAPDALVLDLQIIGGSGLEVLRAVRPALPDLHIVVLTNFATDQHRRACLAGGAEAFFDKSTEFAKLPGLINGWAAAHAGHALANA